MPDLTPNRDSMPSALRERAQWVRLGREQVPALVVHPDGPDATRPVPVVLWMHGRTVDKELDPGRYLRWMRAGFGACAIDLPGHGERREERLQEQSATLEVVEQAVREIDGVVEALLATGAFDASRLAIGGMSAGGMATLARLCTAHPFVAASVEATTGSWRWQRHRAMYHPEIVDRLNPIEHLDGWRAIPFQAIHARHDEWVPVTGQLEFVDALRDRYADPLQVEFVVYERTGAPYEHAGFGRLAADAKDKQLAFLRRALGVS